MSLKQLSPTPPPLEHENFRMEVFHKGSNCFIIKNVWEKSGLSVKMCVNSQTS